MFLQKMEAYRNTHIVKVNKNNELARKNIIVDK